MCFCKKHDDPNAACTCHCEHAKTFVEPVPDNIVRGVE